MDATKAQPTVARRSVNTDGKQREINVSFRFPIEQVSANRVAVIIPPGDFFLVKVDEIAAKEYKLSDSEQDRMLEAAHIAALREIVIVR